MILHAALLPTPIALTPEILFKFHAIVLSVANTPKSVLVKHRLNRGVKSTATGACGCGYAV